MAKIFVDRTACVRCGACVDVCTIAKVFELRDDASTPVRADACWGCGQCVAVCPTDAIDHDRFPLEDCPILDREDLPTPEALQTAFRARRSCRTFQDKPLPREQVREIISDARWSPTAHNSQAFDWLAFDDPTRIDELSEATIDQMARFSKLARNPFVRPFLTLAIGREAVEGAAGLKRFVDRMTRDRAQGGDPIFYHAPVLLIGHGPSGGRFGRDDAIYAAYNLMLTAERHGLATCQIGFFQAVAERSAKLRRAVGIPEGRDPQVALILGYPRHPFRRLLPRRSPNLSWNPR